MGAGEFIIFVLILVILAFLIIAMASDEIASAAATFGFIFAFVLSIFVIKLTRANHCDAAPWNQPTATNVTKTYRVDGASHIVCQTRTVADIP